jgi:hypothetical protein
MMEQLENKDMWTTHYIGHKPTFGPNKKIIPPNFFIKHLKNSATKT